VPHAADVSRLHAVPLELARLNPLDPDPLACESADVRQRGLPRRSHIERPPQPACCLPGPHLLHRAPPLGRPAQLPSAGPRLDAMTRPLGQSQLAVAGPRSGVHLARTEQRPALTAYVLLEHLTSAACVLGDPWRTVSCQVAVAPVHE